MPRLESGIEKDIRKYILSTGGNFHKLNAVLEPGIPDRIAVWPPGLVVYIELKQKNGKLRDTQVPKIEALLSKGFRVLVIRSKDELIQELAQFEDIQTVITSHAKSIKPTTRTKTKYRVRKR